MDNTIKSQKQILKKLNIETLNPMQEEAQLAVHTAAHTLILSPTGSGKTLAFLLPILAEMDPDVKGVQTLILTPSRELAIQIEQVCREMGTGYKVNAVYGGRPVAKDKVELHHTPALLIGTPGRVGDHIRRGTFEVGSIRNLVLDEFDKSLEVGFEEQMSEILDALKNVNKKILTSATEGVEIPDFVHFDKPLTVNYLDEGKPNIDLQFIVSPDKDKLETLGKALCALGNKPGIVFCNYKDSIQRVSDYLSEIGIPHGCFYGGLEQRDRERALIKFRNGTHQLIIATDLAARGLDIPEIAYIIHYHLPHKAEEFTHRNGRTARMQREGTAYVLKWEGEEMPDFIPSDLTVFTPTDSSAPALSEWTTVFLSGGRKDKISKGDIAGLFFKQGKLNKEQVGNIELKSDCAFVAVKRKKLNQLLQLADNTRLKKKKVRIKEV